MLSLFKLEQWFLNFCLCVCVWCVSHSVMSDFLQPYGLYPLQAPLCMEFSRQEYRSGLSFPSPGDLPNPGIKPGSPALQADSLPSEPPGKELVLIGGPVKMQMTGSKTQFQIQEVSGGAPEFACLTSSVG